MKPKIKINSDSFKKIDPSHILIFKMLKVMNKLQNHF